MRKKLKKLRQELSVALCRPAEIGAGAFLCAIGGILLWVNGGSSLYVLRTFAGGHGTGALTASFILWLFAYALYGIRLAVLLRLSCHLHVFTCVLFAYLFDLTWYALFFCTRLTLFAAIVLAAGAALNIISLKARRNAGCLLFLLGLVSIGVEIGFFLWTLCIFL